MKNLKRVFVVALALTCLAALALGVSAVSASDKAAPMKSIWQLTDGFDSNLGVWSCWASVPGLFNKCESMPGGPVLLPPDNVTMTNSWRVGAISGWSDVGRPVSISPFFPGRTMHCTAQMRVYPLWTSLTGSQFNFQLEVIDSPTWTYVSTKQLNFTEANRPHTAISITTPTWIPAHKDVFVRIGVIGGNINNQVDELWVDRLIVSCSY